MRLLYLHQHFSTPRGAGGTRSYELAVHLVERGHEVTMVCGSGRDGNTGLTGRFKKGRRTGIVDGIRVVEFYLPYSNYDSLLKRSVTFCRFSLQSIYSAVLWNCDLIFATSTPLTAGLPGIVARIFRRKPFVFEVRDLWPELPREMGVITNPVLLKAMDILEWLSYHCANGCIGLSPGIVDGIKRRGISPEKVVMIPNGCDLHLFHPKENNSISVGRRKKRVVRAVFTGAHGMANGLDAVLDAAKIIKEKQRSDIQIVFIGDGKQKPALVKRAQKENLDNCIFIDPMPKLKLAKFLQSMDVGLMILANVAAFYYGTSPNKFFDYISSGLPVINNYPGWLADLINQHECGIAVPPNDPNAFAAALQKLADEPEAKDQMGKNARRLAKSYFDRNQLADSFADFIEMHVANK